MRVHSIAFAAALLATTSFHASVASADLPPPDGTKFVGFSFNVTGMNVAPNRVLFTYPCGTSNGAPMAEYHKLEEGKSVGVGRRGGGCPIYSVDKAKYEAWLKTYKPAMGSSDPEVEKLTKESVKCEGAPTLSFSLPQSDPRTGIEQQLTVSTLNDTTCKLNVVALAASPAPSATPKPTTSAPPTSSPSSSATPGAPAKSGCNTSASRATTNAGLFMLLAIGIALGARRTRKRD